VLSTLYTEAFYAGARDGARSSAAVMVPLLLEHLHPTQPPTVVDVGCGEGWWAAAFNDAGCDAIGVDGSYVTTHVLGDRFHPRDLGRRLDVPRSDLAVSMEVAEHLPPERGESFIEDLCRLAPTVLFSAALAGQGGTGHINEQPLSYWVDLFTRNGYAVSGALRWQVWDNPAVEVWYRQNTVVASLMPGAYPSLFDTPLAPPWDVVHPVLFSYHRGL
jgi:SAM-dependent methyltransferase